MKKMYLFLSIFLCLINLNFYSQTFPCFSQAPNSPFSIQAGAYSVSSAVGDFNLDSKLDIALANSGLSNVSIYLGNNNGTFNLAGTYTVNGGPEYIQAKDINNDTYLDLITANGASNNISVLLGNSAGNFSVSTAYSVVANGGPVGFTLADFDGDNDDDIFVSNNTRDTLSFFRNNGNGTFQPQLKGQGDQGMTGIVSEDFNNDGKMDLAVSSGVNNRILVLFGDGAAGYTFSSYYSVGTNPQAIVTLDFNNDGFIDLATPNYSGTTSVLFGNANGTFLGLKNFTTQAGSAFIKVDDFNADGKIDILTGNMSSNSVTLLSGNGNGEVISTINYTVGSSPANVNSGDFNNDGKIDFIAVNRNSDNVHVFLKNSSSQTLSGSLTSVGGDPINGKVIIYKYYPASSSSKLDSLDFMNINSNSYSFTVADSGSYILKAVPSASSLQTTYAQSSTGWKNATVVTHGCLVNSVQNFSVQTFASIGSGSGSMSGVLTQTVGFGQKPSTTMAPYSPASPGNPIGGIIVKGGKNPGGNYFAQTETDASGTYTLSGLPNTLPGESLFIFVDMPGLDTTGTYHKTFTNGESYSGLDFLLDSAKIRPAITTSTTPTPTVDVSVSEISVENTLSIFPNPSQDFVKISFDLKTNSKVKIELIDILGKSIFILEEEKYFTAKKYLGTYNLKDFSDGAYFIKIQVQNTILYRKILISRQ